MVVMDYEVRCAMCNTTATKTGVSSGDKNRRNISLFTCLCFEVTASHICQQGWFFGGNAKIDVYVYARCLRCRQTCRGHHHYWGWPRDDRGNSVIRCTCNSSRELSLRSGEHGHWAKRSLLTVAIAGVAVVTAGAAAGSGALVGWGGGAYAASGLVLGIAQQRAAAGMRAAGRDNVRVTFKEEEYRAMAHCKVRVLEAFANQLAVGTAAAGFGRMACKMAGASRPSEHHAVVLTVEDDDGASRFVTVTWGDARFIAVELFYARSSAIARGIAYMSEHSKAQGVDQAPRVRYARGKYGQRVSDVIRAMILKFGNGYYRANCRTDTAWPYSSKPNVERATGNCQTLTAFLFRHFAA